MSSIIPPFSSASDRGYKFLRVFDQYHGCKGGTIGLYVEGGVPPYTWTITNPGVNFTLEFTETDDQYNSVAVDVDAVLDIRETVTVIDAEGSEVEIIVCTCNPDICCEHPDYSLSSGQVPESLSAGQTEYISVIGGCPRYKWEILETSPPGLEEDYDFFRKYTNTPNNFIFAHEDAINGTKVTVKVTDDCSSVNLIIGATCCDIDYVPVAFNYDETDETIIPGGTADVTIVNGCPPYIWSVEGLGYIINPDGLSNSLTAIVTSAPGDCGGNFSPYCTVTVIDACGTSISTVIRNTAGSWTSDTITCSTGGFENQHCVNGEEWEWYYIDGIKKYLVCGSRYILSGWYGSCDTTPPPIIDNCDNDCNHMLDTVYYALALSTHCDAQPAGSYWICFRRQDGTDYVVYIYRTIELTWGC